MPIHNTDIAAIFEEIAELLEIEGDNPFRIRAYHNAARIIGELGRDVRGSSGVILSSAAVDRVVPASRAGHRGC